MSFNVNDKVTVVDSGKTYSAYRDWVKIYASQWMDQWMDCDKRIDTSLEYTVVAKGKHEDCDKMLYLIQCDDKVYIIGEQGIKAVETVGFKVGDEVKVTKVLHGAPDSTLGMKGVIVKPGNNGKCHSVAFGKSLCSWAYDDEELQLVTEKNKVLTLKEAMKQCFDGYKVVPVNHSYPMSHMFFDECKGFMWYSEPLGYTEKAEAILGRTQWVLWTAPPKFTVNSLVYNTDGTIGKVVEDKGVYEGVRRYSVRFNAVRDAVKGCDETELTEYKQ